MNISKQNVHLFLEKVKEDAALQEEVKQLYEQTEHEMRKELIQLGQELGFHFNEEDLRQLEREREKITEDDLLDDDELEFVSGGLNMFGGRRLPLESNLLGQIRKC